MIHVEPTTEAEKMKSRGIMDLAPRQGNLYAFDPRQLTTEPGWNSRISDFDPADEEDLSLAQSIAEVGVKEPLTVYMRDGQPVVTNGHRRLAATLYAIDTLGAQVKTIPVQTENKYASEADRVLSQVVRNQGKPLKAIELATVCKKLIDLGWDERMIATKIGRSRQYVVDLLNLQAASPEVVALVKSGEISATLASQTLKAAKGDDTAATEKLVSAVRTAKASGKTRATAKHLDRPKVEIVSGPTGHPAYAAGLRRAAEIVRAGGGADEIEAEIRG